MKHFSSPSQRKGELGESLAVKYLQDKGFLVIERNYTKRIGEIDIIAVQGETLHFIEVKTLFMGSDVSYGSPRSGTKGRETGYGKPYDPWQNVSREKLRRFGRTCELYIIERNVSRETPWQIDVIAVSIQETLIFDEGGVPRETRHAKVEVVWNVVA